MTDQELAARWDADHRLAATTSFGAGVAVVLGTAVLYGFGMAPITAIIQGGSAGPLGLNLAVTVEFVTWLAANLWLMPLFGLLVGATLLALRKLAV